MSLPRCSLFSCIVGVFTNICCWSLKSAKRFSIASNCKNKTKQNKTKHEIKTGTKKTGELKLDRTEKNQILNCSQYCNLQSFYKDQFWQKSVLQSDDARKIVMLFVARWLQALTISYLIDSFEIMLMPKEMCFLAQLWQINSKVVFNFGIKKKGDLRI